jgi:hypothetical protein
MTYRLGALYALKERKERRESASFDSPPLASPQPRKSTNQLHILYSQYVHRARQSAPQFLPRTNTKKFLSFAVDPGARPSS